MAVDVVLVRMDKIGDLVVSMPVDEHPLLRGQKVHWFIIQGLSFIPRQSFPQRSFTEFGRKFSPRRFWQMFRWLKTEKPRVIVLLHSPWWVGLAAWLAGVPERMGRLSQWHTFLFLNRGVRQKRSLSEQHESDYNFDLIEQGYHLLGSRHTADLAAIKKTFLRLKPAQPAQTLNEFNLIRKGYRVVHPGMAGSALNWPVEFFKLLIERLAQNEKVVITGTKADSIYLDRMLDLKDHPNIHWLAEQLSTEQLLDVLAEAKSVTAPSTGVLHLAASLGTPVIGIYSPRRVEHPRRWGPKGPYITTLTPQVEDETQLSEEVMSKIYPDHVYQAILNLESAKPAREPQRSL